MGKKETKENVKKLKELVKSFEDKKDTLLAISSCGKDDHDVMFTGSPFKLWGAFYRIMKDGAKDENSPYETEIIASILLAIEKVLEEGGDSAFNLMETMMEMVENVINSKMTHDEFDPSDESCLQCESFAKCLRKYLDEKGRFDIMLMQKKSKKDK